MKRYLAILILAALPGWAAINSATRWEIRNGGTDTNGGGFSYGLGNKEHAAMADLTIDATNNKVITSATHNFVAGDAGKYINVTAGTGWIVGWYRIASAAANAATLDTSPSAAGNVNAGTGDFYYGIDYPSLAADGKNTAGANISATDGAVNASATFTSATAAFDESIAGNAIYMYRAAAGCVGGEVTAQWRQVIAYVDANTVTLDATPAGSPNTCTNVAFNIGGSLASIGQAGAVHVAGNTIWVKYHATAFSSASTTSNIATGRITLATGTAALPVIMRGYETTRGDETANRPTLAWGVNASTNYVVTVGITDSLQNVIVDGVRASYTATRGIDSKTDSSLYRVLVKSCNDLGVFIGASSHVVLDSVEITDISTANGSVYVTGGSVGIFRSYIHDNVAPGVNSVGSGSAYIEDTIFDTNATYSAYTTSQPAVLVAKNCDFYNSGAAGVNLAVASQALLVNSIFETNATYGINAAANSSNVRMVNCAFYNNGTAKYTTATILSRNILGEIIPTGSVFNGAAGGDFSLNNTVGAGMLLRRAGAPSTFPGSATPNYRDVGAAQHLEPAKAFGYAQ